MHQAQNLVDVLRDASGTRSVGYRLSGVPSSAHGLISGHRASIGYVFNHLVMIQDLPAFNGSLTLLSIDAVDLMAPEEFATLEPTGGYGATLFLPAVAQSRTNADSQDSAIRAVLDFCRMLRLLPPQDALPRP